MLCQDCNQIPGAETSVIVAQPEDSLLVSLYRGQTWSPRLLRKLPKPSTSILREHSTGMLSMSLSRGVGETANSGGTDVNPSPSPEKRCLEKAVKSMPNLKASGEIGMPSVEGEAA